MHLIKTLFLNWIKSNFSERGTGIIEPNVKNGQLAYGANCELSYYASGASLTWQTVIM